MDFDTKLSLLDHLFTFISDNKRSKFSKIIESRTKYLTVVLEDLYQSHNASAVLRSCDCFGIQDVHIIENQNEFQVIKDVALGASKWLSLKKYKQEESSTIHTFNYLRKQGYRIVATTPHKNDQFVDELPLNGKVALVFGTELNGLSDVAIENADEYVKIPMYGFTESYNVSVSAALCLYSLSERLRKSDINWKLDQEDKIEVMLSWARKTIKKVDMIEKEFFRAIG